MNLFTINTTVFGMFIQTAGLSKLFAAVAANIVLLTGMDRHVLAQIPPVLESLAAHRAHKPALVPKGAGSAAGKSLEQVGDLRQEQRSPDRTHTGTLNNTGMQT